MEYSFDDKKSILMKYIYIQSNEIFKLDNPLGVGYNLSSDNSEEDFFAGKIIELSPGQKDFLRKYKNASTYEIFKCELYSIQEPTVEQIKIMKIAEVTSYDISSEVNSFCINGISMWIDRNTRSSLMSTIAAYKAQSIDDITLWTESENPVPVTMSVYTLESLLMDLELYAKQCYDTTATHKRNIQQLTDIQQIIGYNYKAGYPEKLNIQL